MGIHWFENFSTALSERIGYLKFPSTITLPIVNISNFSFSPFSYHIPLQFIVLQPMKSILICILFVSKPLIFKNTIFSNKNLQTICKVHLLYSKLCKFLEDFFLKCFVLEKLWLYFHIKINQNFLKNF